MATVIKIKNLDDGYQSIITNGKHSIIGDEPIKSHGTDLGFGPSELVLSGLAMCKVATIRFMARKNGWIIGEVRAELTQEVKHGNDGLKTNVKVAIEIDGDLTQEQKDELFKEANHCYIHRQLTGEWDIDAITELENIKI